MGVDARSNRVLLLTGIASSAPLTDALRDILNRGLQQCLGRCASAMKIIKVEYLERSEPFPNFSDPECPTGFDLCSIEEPMKSFHSRLRKHRL